MKDRTYIHILTILIIFAVTVSCRKDENVEPVPEQKTVEDNGLTKDINDLVSEEALSVMEGLGMPVNRGGRPPYLNGIYLGSKFILKNSNIESDFIGFRYPDFKVQFSNFNSYDLSVQLDYTNRFEKGTGLGAFIVGSGNRFSVFAEVIAEKELDTASFAYVISGSVENDTIRDLHVANFMLDNFGNPNNIWIENNQGRVMYDKDGRSEPIDEL